MNKQVEKGYRMRQRLIPTLLMLAILLPVISATSAVDDYIAKLAELDSTSTDYNKDPTELPNNPIDSNQGPVITHESYTAGPYNFSFDLIGVRDLSVDISELNHFTSPKCSGIRCCLSLKDLNTEETLGLQIVRYDEPRARQAVGDLTNLNEAKGLADSVYGSCFVRWTMISEFSTNMAIDEYTLCGVDSSMSWKATEKVIETLRVEKSE